MYLELKIHLDTSVSAQVISDGGSILPIVFYLNVIRK